ncbi:hypothetical protein ACWDZW_34010 [Streptomyces coeruleorubidus]
MQDDHGVVLGGQPQRVTVGRPDGGQVPYCAQEGGVGRRVALLSPCATTPLCEPVPYGLDTLLA